MLLYVFACVTTRRQSAEGYYAYHECLSIHLCNDRMLKSPASSQQPEQTVLEQSLVLH